MSEIIVPQDTWFNPYSGYKYIPYRYNREDYSAKVIKRNVQELGMVSFSTVWNREEGWWEHLSERRYSTFLFNGYKVEQVDFNDLIRTQDEEIKGKIVELEPYANDLHEGKLPNTLWEILLRFSDGTILKQDHPGHYTEDECRTVDFQNLRTGEVGYTAYTFDSQFCLDQVEYKFRML